MRYYRIKDWNKLYENNRTRELKHMDWVPVPNRHDGDGYTTLVDRPNGAAMLGAWLAILQVASKCGTRGTLLRDAATPHTPQSLARISRLPAAVIEEVIPILLHECKWLEIIENNEVLGPSEPPALPCDNPAPSCGLMTMERKGTEGNGTEACANAQARAREADAAIPTWDDVKTEAQMRAIPEASARAFYDHHEGNSLWLNQHQRLINWKIKLLSWAAQDRQPKPRLYAYNSRAGPPDRNAGTFNAGQDIAALEAKVR